MKTIELEKSSPAALLAIIEDQPGEYGHLFRGQPNALWNLTPSLYRITHPGIGAEDIKTSYDLLEVRIVNRFFDEGMPYLPTLERSFANDRILAQHFGVPTRLLDWSRDPLIATFFAVEDWQSAADAAVFMIMPDSENVPQFLQYNTPTRGQVAALVPPAIDRRIPAQKSVFTIHPYGPASAPFVPLDQRTGIGNEITTENCVVRGFAKIIIPSRLKRSIHQTLLRMGYDRRNLFPGLDGVGADIACRTRSGQVWQ